LSYHSSDFAPEKEDDEEVLAVDDVAVRFGISREEILAQSKPEPTGWKFVRTSSAPIKSDLAVQGLPRTSS